MPSPNSSSTCSAPPVPCSVWVSTAQPGAVRARELLDAPVDVREPEVGMLDARQAAVDDQVLVAVAGAEVGGRDVAQYGPDEAHAANSSSTDWARCRAAPSTPARLPRRAAATRGRRPGRG